MRTHFEVLGLVGQVFGLGSKPQVLKNCPVRTALFFEMLKFCGLPEKDINFWRSPEKLFGIPLNLENTCACVLDRKHSCPWPQKTLPLASRGFVFGLRFFFVSLACSLMFSTPPLTITIKFEQLTKLFEQKNKPSLQFWPIQVSILVHSIIGNNNKTHEIMKTMPPTCCFTFRLFRWMRANPI